MGDDARRLGASGVQLTLTTFLVGLASASWSWGRSRTATAAAGPLVVSAAVCVARRRGLRARPNLAGAGRGRRLVQGFAGAGGMVIGRAVIADLVTGRAAAKAFTLMITVGGVAPVLAPLVGGLLADPVGWRGMLWTVAGLCVAMLARRRCSCCRRPIRAEARAAHREVVAAGGMRQVARHPRATGGRSR